MSDNKPFKLKVFSKPVDSEIIIYLIIWLFILAEPVFVSLSRSEGFSFFFIRDWLRDIPVFIIFIINTVWLVPKLLFNNRIVLYICVVLLLSIVSAIVGELIFKAVKHLFDLTPPDFNHNIRRPPMPENRPVMPPPGGFLGFGFFTQIIIGLLIISLNTAIKVTIKWFKNEEARREKEKEYLKSELAFLQNQVSPHFFMNTLNNIHALIDINGKDAQLVIVKLSKMMRYLLYESEHGNSTLKKELEFLESYIDLMKLRIHETVSINFSVPADYYNVKLPPFLLIPFIENAFKHGVSYQEKSYINIRLEQMDKLITFYCSNSIVNRNAQMFEKGGIGLVNVKKRLDLIYGNKYELAINETLTEFHVKLKILVHED